MFIFYSYYTYLDIILIDIFYYITYTDSNVIVQTWLLLVPYSLIRFYLFNFAIDEMIGIFIGHTSIQDKDFEQDDAKCSP